jgi:hypothetical protein
LIIAAVGILIFIAKKIRDFIMEALNLNSGRVDIQNAIYEKLKNSKNKKNENNRKT